jgi:succinylglutamate desuccinylase
MRGLLDRFREVVAHLSKSKTLVCKELADCVVSITPGKPALSSKNGSLVGPIDEFDICFFGAVHGNEIGGLEVIIRFLEKLPTQPEILKNQRLLLAVGNPRAVESGERFSDCDLNRSFGSKYPTGYEGQRAKTLEPLMLASRVLVDFHQVRRPTPHGFWIFPYSADGYRFARLVGQTVTMITHWGKGFSEDGQCSDEFMIKNNRVGVSIELGQNGINEDQVSHGLEIMSRSLSVLSQMQIPGQSLEVLRGIQNKSFDGPLYTWSEIIPYPKTSLRVLDPNWNNFDRVKMGQRLGEFEGEVINTKREGLVLFPKYPLLDDDLQRETGVPPAAELIRIIRKVDEHEVGKA